MFDINSNQDYIVKVIQSRNKTQYIIPIYVKVYNNIFSMLQLGDMWDFNPSAFKVGFGAVSSLFDKKSFPTQYAFDVDIKASFNVHDDTTGENVRYVVFESSDVDPEISEFHNEIHQYYGMLNDYIGNMVSAYKKEMLRKIIEEDSV
jgi:DNA replication protein DnaD